MIENCCLYFPVSKVPFKKVFRSGQSDGSLFRAPTRFEYEIAEGCIRLNVLNDDLQNHLRGFRGYVSQAAGNGDARARAIALIDGVKSVVGVELPCPVSTSSEAFRSLVHLIGTLGGFMFVADSIMLPDGTFVVGPMAESDDAAGVSGEEPLREVNPAEVKHEGPTEGIGPDRIAMRERHYRLLAERGFRCARWLPLKRDRVGSSLRPEAEIAARLMGLHALFLWVASPESVASTEKIVSYVERNGLKAGLTEDENAMLALPRGEAHEQHVDTIGWRLENLWALAWVLGFEPAPVFHQGQLPDELVERLLSEFLPDLHGTVDSLLASNRLRTAAEVSELEDLFFCAHNAVRSAQLGEPTVPKRFHPVADGGAIHERRQALTWCLSPGVHWEDTDVST